MNFSYDKATFENIPCAICLGERFVVLAHESKNNLHCHTVMCKNCGLIFINPRMTANSYDGYYKYFYRKDRDAIKGTSDEEDVALNFKHALRFGHALGDIFKPFLRDGLTIDIGSSTGGVLAGLREINPKLELLGVEPSVSESDYANFKGIKTVTALFEDFVKQADKSGAGEARAVNILCVQSLNHLLDPAGFIEWSHKTLVDGGHLFLAVKNFRHQVRRAGSLQGGVQIDHPYMFTPETLKLLVESRGFEVVYLDVDEGKSSEQIATQRAKGLNKHHIRLAARKLVRSAVAPQRLNLGIHKGSTFVNRFSCLKERLRFNPLSIRLWYLFRYSRFSKFFRY